MTQGETLYLGLIIVAFVAFAVTLVAVTWRAGGE